MKSISQIFRNNKSLMNEPEVHELIEYCRKLEGIVYEKEYEDKFDKENVLIEIVRDTYQGCEDVLKEDENAIRFNESTRVDFKEAIINLKKFISKRAIDENFKL